MELVQQLYETIRNHKKEDGSLLCDAFIRVPKRRQEPGYYEVCIKIYYLLKKLMYLIFCFWCCVDAFKKLEEAR